jgi:hypothetical protein
MQIDCVKWNDDAEVGVLGEMWWLSEVKDFHSDKYHPFTKTELAPAEREKKWKNLIVLLTAGRGWLKGQGIGSQ